MMPRSNRWALAALVLLCVIIAPIKAPGTMLAEDVFSTVIQRHGTEIIPTPDTADEPEAQWDGFLFPHDNSLSAGLFSRNLRGDMLPDPDEYEPRQGVGGRGGGSPVDFALLSVKGTRVFPLASGTFRISQEFGCVPLDPGYAIVDFCPSDRPSYHTGVDLAADSGTTIYASATGTVNFADVDPASQSKNTVIRIIHDGDNSGYMTEYFHWDTSFVESGEYVIAGQPIGEVGSVGYSTGPHLHFAVFDSPLGDYVEPLDWLRGSESLPVASGDAGIGGADGVMQWASIIKAASERHGIPAALIAAIISVESNGNPDAVSPVGAQGLMQVMPMHLERYNIPAQMWRDPSTNVEAGTRLLAELLAANSTLTNAVGAYFGHGCDVLGTCTDDYLAAVYDWYAYYIPIFTGVAVDAADFEFQLPENTEPSDENQEGAEPTPTPTRTPKPNPEPSPASTPVPTPEPTPTRTPEPTPDNDQGDESPQPTPTPPSDDDGAPEPTPTPDESGNGDEDGGTPDNSGQYVQPDPGVADGHGSRWIVESDANRVLRIDQDNGEEHGSINVGNEPYGVAITEHRVWVTNFADNTVSEIDPKENAVVSVIEVGEGPQRIVAAGESIWIINVTDETVMLINAEDGTVSPAIDVGVAPRDLLVNDEGVWIANSGDSTVSLINVEEHAVVETFETEFGPCFLVANDDTILVASCESEDVTEIER